MGLLIQLFFKTKEEKSFEKQVLALNEKRWTKSSFVGMHDSRLGSMFFEKVRERSAFRMTSNLKFPIIAIWTLIMAAAGIFYQSKIGIAGAMIAFAYLVLADKDNYFKEMFFRRKELAPVILAELEKSKKDTEEHIVNLKKRESEVIEGRIDMIKEYLSSGHDLKAFAAICTDEQLQKYWAIVKEKKQSAIIERLNNAQNILDCTNDEIAFLTNLT